VSSINSVAKKIVEIAIFVSLLVFVFIPVFYLFTFILLKWHEIYGEIFANPLIGSLYWTQIKRSLGLSFRLAFLTLIIDLMLGIPIAYFIARKKFPGKAIVENIITLPLVIPTSGFGFALLITWTASESLPALLGLRTRIDYVIPFVDVPLLMLLVHVSLTFPYIVKTVSASLYDLEKAYEIISESLGAHPLTTFRKVTLPLIVPSILSGSVLSFARSLGETGATMVVSGVSTTASIAIVRWELQNRVAPAAFLGGVLVALALLLILPIEYIFAKNRRSYIHGMPKTLEENVIKIERKISPKLSPLLGLASILFLVFIVILPIATLFTQTFYYWSSEPYTGRYEGSVLYQLFGPSQYFYSIVKAMSTSFITAILSTFLSAYLAILAIFAIAKTKFGRIIRILLKVPLVIPTSALGLSMILFWGPYGLKVLNPGIWLIIFTHIVFSTPIIVETGLSSYESARTAFYEETARTLGASFYDVTETISLPMIKRGLFAGSILAFTHSLGETGATLLVMGKEVTVSALVVSLVESLAIPAALFASALLVVISLMLLTVFVKLLK